MLTKGRTFSMRKGPIFDILDADGRVIATGGQVHRPGFASQAIEVLVADGYSVRVAVPPRDDAGPVVPARDWRETVIDRRKEVSR